MSWERSGDRRPGIVRTPGAFRFPPTTHRRPPDLHSKPVTTYNMLSTTGGEVAPLTFASPRISIGKYRKAERRDWNEK